MYPKWQKLRQIGNGSRTATPLYVPLPNSPLRNAVLVSLLVGGCASGPQDSYRGPAEGKLSNNGLVLEMAVLDDLVTNALSLDASLMLDEQTFGPLLASDSGKSLFGYLMTCALGEEQQVQVGSSGQVYTGNLGLASDWLHESCDSACQGWVSACVLAHTNAFGKTVQFSPRGAHPSLAWNEAIIGEFDYEEAAYYGNLFLPPEQRVAAVCAGASLYTEEFADNEVSAAGKNFVAGRIHSAGTDDIIFTGLCGPLAMMDLPLGSNLGESCTSNAGGFYQDCIMTSDEDWDTTGVARVGPRTSEVITVFLEH